MSIKHIDDQRLLRGISKFEEVTDLKAEEFIESFQDVAPDLGKYILEWEFGDLYHRPEIDLKTRETVIIASCATLGATGIPALKMHIKCGLKAGLTKSEIAEILMQIAFSAGLPIAIGAINAAKEVFNEID